MCINVVEVVGTQSLVQKELSGTSVGLLQNNLLFMASVVLALIVLPKSV